MDATEYDLMCEEWDAQKEYDVCEYCEDCPASCDMDCERGCECGHEHEDEYDIHPPRI